MAETTTFQKADKMLQAAEKLVSEARERGTGNKARHTLNAFGHLPPAELARLHDIIRES